jgi:hypothetical protein
VEDALLRVAEVGRAHGIGFVHGALHGVEMNAVLFCAGDEEDAFKRDIIKRQGSEEVLKHGSCRLWLKGKFSRKRGSFLLGVPSLYSEEASPVTFGI